jgi:hypothetical protein
MAANKIFDFVLRKERVPRLTPPYELRGHVVLKEPIDTPGFGKNYAGVTDYLKNYEEAEKAIALMIKDIYALKKKVADEFRAVATAQKKLDDAVAEEARIAAKKAAEAEKKKKAAEE